MQNLASSKYINKRERKESGSAIRVDEKSIFTIFLSLFYPEANSNRKKRELRVRLIIKKITYRQHLLECSSEDKRIGDTAC